MRMLRKNPNRADVSRSLSDLSILWGKADMENPAIPNQQGRKDKPMPDGTKGLDGIRPPGNGNSQAGKNGNDAD